jgi:hypothetical protein
MGVIVQDANRVDALYARYPATSVFVYTALPTGHQMGSLRGARSNQLRFDFIKQNENTLIKGPIRKNFKTSSESLLESRLASHGVFLANYS